MYTITSIPPSGKHYQKVTKRNYLQFFEDYMTLKDERLSWFLPEIANLGGFSVELLDFSSESLVPIWEAAMPHISRPSYYDFDGLENKLPFWINIFEGISSAEYGTYSPDSLWIIDGLTYYFGDVFVKNHPNDFMWAPYCPHDYNRVMGGLMPSIIHKSFLGLATFPFIPVTTACVGLWFKNVPYPEKNKLLSGYRYISGQRTSISHD